jgi:hypothetical protein
MRHQPAFEEWEFIDQSHAGITQQFDWWEFGGKQSLQTVSGNLHQQHLFFARTSITTQGTSVATIRGLITLCDRV